METMEAGREMDRIVAEKVMGLRFETRLTGKLLTDPESKRSDLGTFDGPYPPYSTSIAAAWEVLGRFEKEHQIRMERSSKLGRWSCRIVNEAIDGPEVWEEEEADTAPLVICLAALSALKAVGG